MSEWWTDEDHSATVTALLDAWTKRGGSPHADATTLLAALAPTVDRVRREAKAEALREAEAEARSASKDRAMGILARITMRAAADWLASLARNAEVES